MSPRLPLRSDGSVTPTDSDALLRTVSSCHIRQPARVHFFPLTVAWLPAFQKKKSHNVRRERGGAEGGPRFLLLLLSLPPFFNPLLTIHLSVPLLVCLRACVFQRKVLLFADTVMCLLPPPLTGERCQNMWQRVTDYGRLGGDAADCAVR